MTGWYHLLAFGWALALASAIASSGNLTPGTQTRTPIPTSSPVGEPAEGAGDRTPTPPKNPGNPNAEVQPRPGAVSGATDSELQTVIQKALRSEPTLANDSLAVSVSANTIELSGSVSSGRELLTAARIARSYAGSKWLVNHIEVHQPTPTPEAKSPAKPEPPQF